MSFRTRGRGTPEHVLARRKREDEAERLKSVVPNLAQLHIECEETRGGTGLPESKHVRRIPIDGAPAVFLLPCGDSSCMDGGHDLTNEILRELRAKNEKFEIEDECYGTVGSVRCGRMLRAVIVASYRD